MGGPRDDEPLSTRAAWAPRPTVVARACVVAALFIAPAPPVQAAPARRGEHWPAWPNTVDELAKPFYADPPASLERRLRVLTALEPYATPLVTPHLVHALADPSSRVQMEALRQCAERHARGCLPAAAERWRSEPPVALQTALLRVLALDTDHLDTLYGALGSPNATVRQEAARLVGQHAAPEARETASTRLAARAADADASVRAEVALALGLVGSAKATGLALSALLRDTDPTVRRAAARAVALTGDVSLLGPVRDLGERSQDSNLALSALDAVLSLPGQSAEEVLLGWIDTPPRGLRAEQIVRRLVLRSDPSEALRAELLRRRTDESIRDAVLETLAAWGEAARAREAAVDPLWHRGAALLGKAPLPDLNEPMPDPSERAAYIRALAERHAAGQPLPPQAPPWLDSELLRLAGTPRSSPSAVALVALGVVVRHPVGPELRAAALRRAQDPATSERQRCAWVELLGPGSPPEVHAVLNVPNARVRACGYQYLWRPEQDPDPLGRVRSEPSPAARTAAASRVVGGPAEPRWVALWRALERQPEVLGALTAKDTTRSPTLQKESSHPTPLAHDM